MRKSCPPSRRVKCSYVLWIAVTDLTISGTTPRNLFFTASSVSSHCTITSSLSHGFTSSSKLCLLSPLPNSQTAVRSWNMAASRKSKRCPLAKLTNLTTKGWNGSSMSWLSWRWAMVLNADLMLGTGCFFFQLVRLTDPSRGLAPPFFCTKHLSCISVSHLFRWAVWPHRDEKQILLNWMLSYNNNKNQSPKNPQNKTTTNHHVLDCLTVREQTTALLTLQGWTDGGNTA